ncbi:MAG TPA: pilin [bacterium]|nr:pilin [bacterium]
MKKILTIVILFTISFSYLLITTRSILAADGTWLCMCTATGRNKTFIVADKTACDNQCKTFCTSDTNFTCTVDNNNPPQTDLNNPPQADKNNPPKNTNNTQTSKLDNPLSTSFGSTIPQIAAKIIKIFLGLIGTISFVMFIYGGFLIFTAMGNASKAKTGMNTLVYASLGILVVFTSYAMLKFVLSIFNLS